MRLTDDELLHGMLGMVLRLPLAAYDGSKAADEAVWPRSTDHHWSHGCDDLWRRNFFSISDHLVIVLVSCVATSCCAKACMVMAWRMHSCWCTQDEVVTVVARHTNVPRPP